MHKLIPRCLTVWVGAAALCVVTFSAAGQDALPVPRVMLASPLAVSPGKSTILTLRGIKLEETTRVEVRGVEGLVELPLMKKERVGLPSHVEAQEAGDTQVEVKLHLPDGFGGASIAFVLETPAGKSVPYDLAVLSAQQLAPEAEANGGFRQAQLVEIDSHIQGTIQQQRDVDVYRWDGKAGQQIVAELTAQRRGSVLDGILTLFDAQGRLLATADDRPASDAGGRDPILRFTLPADGTYFLSLMDAHDRGGPTHPYLLQIR